MKSVTFLSEMDCEVEQYCLRWKYHHSNLQFMFAQLLENQSMCDVTLVCEGKTLRVHKIMLSACSAYFDSIFSRYDENDPIVILEGARFEDVNALVDFMYRGEITVDKSRLNDLIETAEELQVKGLAAVSWRSTDAGWKSVGGNVSGNLLGSVSDDSESNNFSDVVKRKISDVSNAEVEDVYPDDDIGENKVPNSGDLLSLPTVKKRKVYPSANSVTPSKGSVSSCLSENESDCEKESGYNKQGGEVASSCSATKDSGSSNGERAPPPPDIPELKSVVKMTDHIALGGWRPHFWELDSTKRVMEAIKNKKIEMKTGAELLGVTYGTLYGRYREVHGYLKQPQRDFWHDIRYADVLSRLKKREISLFTAADILSVNETALATHIGMSEKDSVYPLTGECEPVTNRAQDKPKLSKTYSKLIPIVQVKNVKPNSTSAIPPSIIRVIENTLAKKAIKLVFDNTIRESNETTCSTEGDRSADTDTGVDTPSQSKDGKLIEKPRTVDEIKLEIKEELTEASAEKSDSDIDEDIDPEKFLVKEPGDKLGENKAEDDLVLVNNDKHV